MNSKLGKMPKSEKVENDNGDWVDYNGKRNKIEEDILLRNGMTFGPVWNNGIGNFTILNGKKAGNGILALHVEKVRPTHSPTNY